MLELAHVHAGYGRLPVLFDISLTVRPGELIALAGPNGAGKSTLLKAIIGVVTPTSGTVTFDGERVTHEPPHARFGRGIALSPEGRRIFKTLTVHENLVAGSAGVPAEVVAGQTKRVFELFPILGERAGQEAGSLSGGEQQMLAIGRALVSAPQLLLVDEMSMGLAPLVVAELHRALRRLAEEGLAIVVVDQFGPKTLLGFDRVCVLEQGAVVFDGRPGEVTAEHLTGATLAGGRHHPHDPSSTGKGDLMATANAELPAAAGAGADKTRRLAVPPLTPRLLGGALLVVAGLVSILVAWGQTRDINNAAAQIPYLASGGLIGVCLVALGGALLVSAGKRPEEEVVARLNAQVADLAETVEWTADVLEQIAGRLNGTATLPGPGAAPEPAGASRRSEP